MHHSCAHEAAVFITPDTWACLQCCLCLLVWTTLQSLWHNHHRSLWQTHMPVTVADADA